MTERKKKVAKFACRATAILLLSGGCALRHGDYALEGEVRVELSPPSGPLFNGIQIEQSECELVVSGFGRRPSADGYVEIFLISPEGALLAQVQAELLPPLPVPNRTYNYRFRASVPLIPPAGSTLRVVYVEAADPKGEGILEGGRNTEGSWLATLQ